MIFWRSYNFIDLHPSPISRVDPNSSLLEQEGLLEKFSNHQAYVVDRAHVLFSRGQSGEYDFDGEPLGDSADICVFHDKELALHVNGCFTRGVDGTRLDWKAKAGAYKGMEKAKLHESWMNALKNSR